MPPKKSKTGVSPGQRKDTGRKRKADGTLGGKKNPSKKGYTKKPY